MNKKFILLGSPVEHSLSPMVHQAFAKQFTEICIDYTVADINLSNVDFLQKITELKNNGFNGVNITAPLKEIAFKSLDNCTDRAKHAQAVNTIYFKEDGGFQGDNTDGIGLVRDLRNNNITVADKKILIMGAGGVVRGILRPLLTLNPKKICIVNRTKPKILELINYFKPWGKIKALDYASLVSKKFDVIINATSSPNITEILPKQDFNIKDTICYDVNYGDRAKLFLQWALTKGAIKAVNGLGMLVEQAAESFYYWNNARPETDRVIVLLRNS